MSTQPIDYEALAKQARQSATQPAATGDQIDYDALATQVKSTPINANLFLPPGVQTPIRKTPELPQPTNQDIKRGVLKSLPYVGATAAAMMAPEGLLAWPAIAAAGGGAAAGSLAQQGGEKLAGLPEAPQSFGDVARRTTSDALNKGVLPEAGGRILGATISRILSPYINPTKLYQSGLKPSGAPAQALRDVQTGIREGITLGPESGAIAKSRWQKLNSDVKNVIASNPQDIPAQSYVGNVQAKLDALRAKWGADATHGSEFVDKIDDLERQFLIDHGNAVPINKIGIDPTTGVYTKVKIAPEDISLAELRQQVQAMPAQTAQAIKKQTYETIRTAKETAWDSGSHPGLSLQINMQIAQSMKEELEQIYPSLKNLNGREGEIIGLEDQLLRYSKREANKQITPYFVLAASGAMLGGHVGGSYGAGAGATAGMLAAHMLRGALEDPAVKSKLAIALYRAMQVPAVRGLVGVGSVLAPEALPAAVRYGEYNMQRPPRVQPPGMFNLPGPRQTGPPVQSPTR